jgi:hypothetical protein
MTAVQDAAAWSRWPDPTKSAAQPAGERAETAPDMRARRECGRVACQRRIGVLALDIAGGQITGISSIVNPDKLRHLGQSPTSDGY